MDISIVLYVIFAHWVADFVLQTDWQAQNKSKNNLALLKHTSIYSLTMSIGLSSILVINYGLNESELYVGTFITIGYFGLITFVAHTITDYFTSRINSRLWGRKEVHNFFVSVGFDQFLHYAQLFITLQYLFN